MGASPDELTTAFDGVQYYSVAEANKAFAGDFVTKTFVDVLKAAKQASWSTRISPRTPISCRLRDGGGKVEADVQDNAMSASPSRAGSRSSSADADGRRPAARRVPHRRSHRHDGVPVDHRRRLRGAVHRLVGSHRLRAGKPIFLPAPGAVWSKMAELSANGTLWQDAGISIYRMLFGFALASLMAIPIGILIGCFRVWEASIEPFVDFVRYMPVVAFVPLTILWAGTSDMQKFVIIWIGTFFQQVLMVMDNVKRIPPDFVGLGRTLGLSETRILRRIVLPSALPGIWDTLRISLGWAWTWLVLAELVAATSGLGYRITVSQRFFQTQTIIGYILFLGVLGLITDQTMKALERVLFRYAREG